jgi:hypothetical protein
MIMAKLHHSRWRVLQVSSNHMIDQQNHGSIDVFRIPLLAELRHQRQRPAVLLL